MIDTEALIANHEFCHSTLQQDYFITIRSGGTPYGCYRQALREFVGRHWNLRLEYLRIDGLRHSLSMCGTSEREQRKAGRIQTRLEEAMWRIKDQEREYLRFYCQAAALHSHLGFDEEPLTPERRAALDEEMWEHQIRCRIALDVLSEGKPLRQTLDLFACLPIGMRRRISADCLHKEKWPALVDWFLDYTPPVPPPIRLTEEQRRALLSCASSRSPRLLPSSFPMDAGRLRKTNTPTGSESAKPALIGVECDAACAAASLG